jgi:glycosyltransferase involved in cell wall biosynthesis
MQRVLISTVYNEEASLPQWIAAVRAQTIKPDEFVIVDGGSTDNTVELLRKGFGGDDFPAPKVLVRKSNIAEGRNLAIQNSTSEIIASVDAGSVPDPHWLDEITKPFAEDPGIDVVGGQCPMLAVNAFQKQLAELIAISRKDPFDITKYSPSSRNVAYTREAWAAVGGYPEWLTLTGEDALFNYNLHAAGARFYYRDSAIVSWEGRPNLEAYLKMMSSYAFGSAEVGQGAHVQRQRLLATLVPPIILFSSLPLSFVALRYLRNAASSWGWITGHLTGRRPPKSWRRINDVWLSPETLNSIAEKRFARTEYSGPIM